MDHSHLDSLCYNSEEEAPDYDLAHVLETVRNGRLDAVLHDLTDREWSKTSAHFFLQIILSGIVVRVIGTLAHWGGQPRHLQGPCGIELVHIEVRLGKLLLVDIFILGPVHFHP